eukprot:6805818-Pyramimonas_sp.AAC.1
MGLAGGQHNLPGLSTGPHCFSVPSRARLGLARLSRGQYGLARHRSGQSQVAAGLLDYTRCGPMSDIIHMEVDLPLITSGTCTMVLAQKGRGRRK